VPTYNEAENIEKKILSLLPLGCSVLVVDDSSPDGTAEVVRDCRRKFGDTVELLLRPARAGLGTAYIDAFRLLLSSATPPLFISQMDADASHPVELLKEMLEAAEEGYDLILASRFIKSASYGGLSPPRRMLTRGALLLCRSLIGYSVADYTTGFRLWRTEALRRIPLTRIRSKSFAFQIEMLWWAKKRSLRIRELPMRFTEREEGVSKLDRKTVTEALRLLARIAVSDTVL